MGICPVVLLEDIPHPEGKGMTELVCLLYFIHGQDHRGWHMSRVLIKD